MTLTKCMVLICLLAAASFSFAEEPFEQGEMMPRGKWWRMSDVSKTLNLTPDEQEKLDNLFMQNRKNLIDLRTNVEKEKLALEQIMETDPFDESACLSQHKKMQEAISNITAERFKFLVEVRKILGKERFQQFRTKFNEFHMERRKEFKERGKFKPDKSKLQEK